jgi:hypothetical protein
MVRMKMFSISIKVNHIPNLFSFAAMVSTLLTGDSVFLRIYSTAKRKLYAHKNGKMEGTVSPESFSLHNLPDPHECDLIFHLRVELFASYNYIPQPAIGRQHVF